MMLRALRNSHPAALDAPPPPGFEAQTDKPAYSDVNACPTSRKVPRCLQDLPRSRPTGSLLELAIVFLLDLADTVFITFMYSSSFVHHVDRP